ncbi:hypothetical protein SAMN05192574_104441 [Mucilaginibacter gossypiicola]|uniref:ABC-2 family transporter protein n=1 Tax=Mucilaginibacter gossypiicola TaxID=551995 RepID=A0A1H8K3C8_9SPHI|nr:hypothetical protein [Mucilaginibacter gossypiicola]SEN87559.1 hypothetical protein SAMN05192574_104441 [Mucilaginibacter gossypiicola]
MHNYFNLKRFGLLFMKHTVEHYRTYLMSASVLAGVFLLGGSFIFYMIPGPVDAGFQMAIFGVLILIAGPLFTSTIFADLGDKRRAIPILTLPASQLEKFMVSWIYSYIIFLLVYTGVFYLVLFILMNLKPWPGHQSEILSLFQDKFVLVMMLFSFLHSVTLYGAIRFEKLHFIKTGFSFFIFYALLILVNTVFVRFIVGRPIKPVMPFSFLNFQDGINFYSVGLNAQQSAWVFIVVPLISLLFWIAAYFKLKEKQA